MRFGKEFVSQMIPEWQEAYIDYAHLKTILQDIQASRKNSDSNSQNTPSFARNLTRRYNRDTSVFENHDIVVNTVIRDEEELETTTTTTYETTFLKAGEAGGDFEVTFFRTLDREFNKVNNFYRLKVETARNEALALNKQMDALIAFRHKVMDVKKPSVFDSVSVDINGLASEVGSSSKSREHRVALADLMRNDDDTSKESILERIRMNKTREITPLSAIKTILKVRKQDELKFTRENLKEVEKRLQIAFIEFYQKLRHLKNYSFLNASAVSKIMKKYDKIAKRNAAKLYMEMVDRSYLSSSDEVHQHLLKVESIFIEHFSNSNRRQGMSLLRPKINKERHLITFSTGFFFGCGVSLIVALGLIIHARNIMGTLGQRTYMETMFPLYRFFGFVVLHMIMYAANIYFWRRYRVNYSFIFGFKQGTELGYRHVLLLSFGLGTLSLCAVLVNLDMEMDAETKDYRTVTELVPLFLLVLVIAIVLCPLNILYRSSRYFFLAVLFRCIAAPFYTVNLPDFFLADQLTSQVQALRSLEFYMCYYGFGDFRHRRRNTCTSNIGFTTFYFIVAVIPYWLRLLQCIRRIIEEKDLCHGYNAIKYLLTIIAACLRTAYTLNRGTTWNITAWVFSGVATFYGTYWDIVVDWGLLQRGCKNSFLRDKLLVPHKTVYYAAMVLNVLLRLVWLQTVLNLKFSFLHRETMVALLACLEIIRRGIWSFFRLENEHLNNVGRYRAFKTVPLPFNYEEDGDHNN
ncbi:PREDICTED: phosphate transporter PHO1 homolog 4 [Camelina sativa]|uniref:Phosphate transporter PHO1 homolog 4 n=1 Tax=Camelina sativa TaxID=90675 RepID=A0ABM0UBX2_CAMSA|nr:PREDICTED: phosphate transporter PHO1 homolog 4 [Camelina sativa]